MSANNNIKEKLLHLPDNLRATVEVIQNLYEKGAPRRYSDIKAARMAAGMTEGSDTTIKKAFEAWQQIYEIYPERYDSPQPIDKLVKRTIENLRNEISQAYKQESEVQIAAAEESVDQIKDELKSTQIQLQNCTDKLNAAQEENFKLTKEFKLAAEQITNLKEENQALTTEIGQLHIKLSVSEDKIKQAQVEIKQREGAFDSLKETMENQRQSQIKIIDDWQQQYKSANKTIEQLRQQLDTSEKTNQSLQSQLAVISEAGKKLKNDLTDKDAFLKVLEQNYKTDKESLLEQIGNLHKTIAKLEANLESNQIFGSSYQEILKRLNELNQFDPKQLAKLLKQVKDE